MRFSCTLVVEQQPLCVAWTSITGRCFWTRCDEWWWGCCIFWRSKRNNMQGELRMVGRNEGKEWMCTACERRTSTLSHIHLSGHRGKKEGFQWERCSPWKKKQEQTGGCSLERKGIEAIGPRKYTRWDGSMSIEWSVERVMENKKNNKAQQENSEAMDLLPIRQHPWME